MERNELIDCIIWDMELDSTWVDDALDRLMAVWFTRFARKRDG
jgi:hypothetical protein